MNVCGGTATLSITIIPNNKNFSPRKLVYQEILGYYFLIFSFIFQVK